MVKITVNINGVDYNLKGKESEEYLRDIASYVDERIKEVLAKNKMLSISQASVLAAVNITDILYKTDDELRNIAKLKNSIEKENLALNKSLEEVKINLEKFKEESSKIIDGKENTINGLKEDRNNLLKERDELNKSNIDLKVI